jgi:hypothetical protein
MDSAHIEGLITHEKCQVLTEGTCDQNFRTSALIEALKSQEAIQKRSPRIYGRTLSPSEFQYDFQQARGGGVTGVEGGGDGRIQDYLKSLFLQYFYLLCHDRMSMEEFHQVYDLIGTFEYQIDEALVQGVLRVDNEKRVVYIPLDAMKAGNFDANQDAVEGLMKALLEKVRKDKK